MTRRAFLTDAERQSLFGVPTAREELARHYVLSTRDLALVEARRGDANRIGFAVQLAMLRHPGSGFTLEGGAPPHLVAFVGSQIGVSADAFDAYAPRGRSDSTSMLPDQVSQPSGITTEPGRPTPIALPFRDGL